MLKTKGINVLLFHMDSYYFRQTKREGDIHLKEVVCTI